MELIGNSYRKNVLAIIFDGESRILLGKNTVGKQIRMFPKGGIKEGESKLDALFRELYEELSLTAISFDIVYINPKFFEKSFTKEQIDWKIMHKGEYYIGKSETIFFLRFLGGEINLDREKELSEYKWVSVDELPEYIESDDLLDMIDLTFLKQLIKKYQ